MKPIEDMSDEELLVARAAARRECSENPNNGQAWEARLMIIKEMAARLI